MHRCWTIPEILDLIFQPLQLDLHAGSLRSLAMTCRRFQEPALNYLWRDQYTLLPLVKCLPECWFQYQDPEERGFYPIVNSVPIYNVADWDRLIYNAARIRVLDLGPEQLEIPLDIMELLNLSAPIDTLFPNLEHLTWGPQTAIFPYARFFLGPKINGINLTVTGDASRLAFLPWLALRYPSLTYVEISLAHFNGSRRHSIRASSSMVRALTGPRVLSIYGVDEHAWAHLGSLATLESLTLHAVEDDVLLNNSNAPQPMFPSLRTLDIHAAGTAHWTSIFSAMSRPPLGQFFGRLDDPAREEQTSVLFSTMHAHLQRTSLTMIDITLGEITDVVLLNPEPYTVGV
ncbi:hypothetical protein B0H11DRAFT_1956227 [Mycena galericulata]|nr:hypothetical protein B0H11DRAFT_1956227 [Mycena galericulata]